MAEPDAPAWTHIAATASAEQTQAIARKLGSALEPGDLVVLTGDLGAGKTTFTQGLGQGLGVRPGIISPTFVLVRVHPNQPSGSRPGGPDLVHADAYRLDSPAELDDLDLESSLDDSVTVIEWGAGMAEHLSDSVLHIRLERSRGETPPCLATTRDDIDDEQPRQLEIRAFGPRWVDRQPDLGLPGDVGSE